jgi:hypothetical protein
MVSFKSSCGDCDAYIHPFLGCRILVCDDYMCRLNSSLLGTVRMEGSGFGSISEGASLYLIFGSSFVMLTYAD